MVSYPERSSKGRDQWFIERGFRSLGKGPSRIAASLLIFLWKACGWGAHVSAPAAHLQIEPLHTNTCTCFRPKWVAQEFCDFTEPALASRPTRLCPVEILWADFPFHPILKAPCNQTSAERGLLILLAPLRRSFCFQGPGVCLCPL